MGISIISLVGNPTSLVLKVTCFVKTSANCMYTNLERFRIAVRTNHGFESWRFRIAVCTNRGWESRVRIAVSNRDYTNHGFESWRFRIAVSNLGRLRVGEGEYV